MNIIVLIVDTLRYDHLRVNGNDWIQTPNMDRLGAKSWRFDRCFPNSYPTIPFRTDAFTGKYGRPFHAWRPLPWDWVTLPRALGENGYATQLIHDTPHLVNGGHNFDWPFHAWTQIRGGEVDRPWIGGPAEWPENWANDPAFDIGIPFQDTKGHTSTYMWANRNRKQLEDWNTPRLFLTASEFLRDNRDRDNFFLWVDCFDPHEPWDVPPEYARMYDKEPNYDGRIDPRAFTLRNKPELPQVAKDRMAAHYAGKVSWVDHWLGKFLDTLEETGLEKRTAILFGGDHGTNIGERGQFGKGFPVREQEGHVPFFVSVPDGGSGRCDFFVQPQDIFATAAGIAGVEVPEELESYDVLKLAQEGKASPRTCALSGRPPSGWRRPPDGILFTLFDRDEYLEVAADPADCRLTAYGSLDNVAANNRAQVEELHEKAIDEIERRGTDPAIIQWLRSHGQAEFPSDCHYHDGYPLPPNYRPYFGRLYGGE